MHVYNFYGFLIIYMLFSLPFLIYNNDLANKFQSNIKKKNKYVFKNGKVSLFPK